MPATTEARRDWGESAALVVTLVIFFGVPNRYTLGGPFVTLAIGTALALATTLTIFMTLVGSRRAARAVVLGATVILAAALVLCMAKVVYLVVYQAGEIQGVRLLETALSIWISNVTIFAVIYHWIGEREFAFPRPGGDEDAPLTFLDFFFLSFTTSTAFSPTDTAPLTTRARMLVMLESAISLTTIAIAAARAVNILS